MTDYDPGSDPLIERFSTPDAELLDQVFDIYDSSPTLDRWVTNEADREDMGYVLATMAGAFDAGARARERHEQGLGEAVDLPIGAAIIDPDTGKIYSAFSRDAEKGVDTDHAEVLAIRWAKACGVDLSRATIGSTLECCPTCLDAVEDAGIPRAVYGASREMAENIGLLKEHGPDRQGPQLVIRGREKEDKYHFEFFQLPDREFQEACLELLIGFKRDLEGKQSQLIDQNISDALRAKVFRTVVQEWEHPSAFAPDRLKEHQIDEKTILITALKHMLRME